MKKVAFVDRDGTLIVEPDDHQIDSLEKLRFVPGIVGGLSTLLRHGFELVMVTNQDALGSAGYPLETFERIQDRLLGLLEGEGIRFAQILICPHVSEDGCDCRKPRTGLVEPYLAANDVDLDRSFVVGDRRSDVAFARALGCRSARLSTEADPEADFVSNSFADICRHIVRHARSARVERKTSETSIVVEVALDGVGAASVSTGIGFFDHMLEQIARHASIDLSVAVEGDLYVDEHHTVEDTGLALGEAIDHAIGDKRGIGRYGFLLPMDDALARVALDLGGRPFLDFDVAFSRERVGELPTELVEEFFRALSQSMRANIHVTSTARNDHHRIEAIFKAFARSLRQAIALDVDGDAALPTTKGVL